MKTSANRKSELAIQRIAKALDGSVDVLESLPSERLPAEVARLIRATACLETTPTSTLSSNSDRAAVMAWMVDLLRSHFGDSTIWIGTGVEAFPILHVRPRSNDWIHHLIESHESLDQVLISEDLKRVGRFSAEEDRYDFIVLI